MTDDRLRSRRPAGSSGRIPIAAAALVALSLFVSACGSGGSSGSAVAKLATTTAAPATSTGASTTAGTPAAQERDLLAFSACMRKRGVTGFPDPTRNANGSYGFSTDIGQLRRLVRGAQKTFDTCEPLLVKSGILSAQNIGKFQQQMLAFSKCMRAHGIKDFPDPNANGRFGGQLKGLDRNAPGFQTAVTACRPTLSKAIAAFTVGGTSG